MQLTPFTSFFSVWCWHHKGRNYLRKVRLCRLMEILPQCMYSFTHASFGLFVTSRVHWGILLFGLFVVAENIQSNQADIQGQSIRVIFIGHSTLKLSTNKMYRNVQLFTKCREAGETLNLRTNIWLAWMKTNVPKSHIYHYNHCFLSFWVTKLKINLTGRKI